VPEQRGVELVMTALQKLGPEGRDAIAELQTTINSLVPKQGMASGFVLKNVDVEPDAVSDGAVVYAFGGVLKRVNANGSRVTL
jgi:hypothetical protein